MSSQEEIEKSVDAYLFNLITMRCRSFEGEDGKKVLYFSSRLNVAKIVKEDVLKVVDAAIQQEMHGETIPFGDT